MTDTTRKRGTGRQHTDAVWSRWTPGRGILATLLIVGAIGLALFTALAAAFLGTGFWGAPPSEAERTMAGLLWLLAAAAPASACAIVGALRHDHRWLVPAGVLVSGGLLAASNQLAVYADPLSGGSADDGAIIALVAIHLALVVCAFVAWGMVRRGAHAA